MDLQASLQKQGLQNVTSKIFKYHSTVIKDISRGWSTNQRRIDGWNYMLIIQAKRTGFIILKSRMSVIYNLIHTIQSKYFVLKKRITLLDLDSEKIKMCSI